MSENQQDNVVSSNKLRRLAKSRKYDDLEAAWLEAIEQNQIELEGMFEALAVPARRGEGDRAEPLLWLLAEKECERTGPAQALAIVAKAAPLFPQSRSMRMQTAELYRTVHASVEHLEPLLEMTILGRSADLKEAMRQADALRLLKPGTYVIHGRRIGKVIGVDTGLNTVGVSFPDGKEHLDIATAASLTVLPDDDFRALAVFDPERLATTAKEDPEKLLVMVLQAYGPRMQYRDLKHHLECILPSSAWSRWWSKARPRIRHSSHIDMSGASQPKFFLRAEPLSFEEETRMRFNAAPSREEKLTCALGYLTDLKKGLAPDEELAAHMASAIAKLASAGGPDSLDAAAPLAMLAEIRATVPAVSEEGPFSLADLLSDTEDASTILASLPDNVALCALSHIRDALPNKWPSIFAQAMPLATTGVCDWIAAEFRTHTHEGLIAPMTEQMAKHPGPCAGALMWLWKAFGMEEYAAALQSVNRVRIAAAMLRGCERLNRSDAPDARSQMHQIPKVLSAKSYQVLRSAVQEGDRDDADDVRRIVQHHITLTDQYRDEITRIIRLAHPDLFAKDVPRWEEATLYTTAAGLKKHRKEYERLVNADLVQIGKEIGKAAELGDLSENAEFTAALEERDRLSNRATVMEAELANTRLITADMVQGNEITIGSAVTARNADSGEDDTFRFLGPWDVDPDRGVYSYRAPLGLAFMGKTPGDTVEFKTDEGTRRWEILEVSPGI